jgi:hypothetical protein
VLAMAAGMAVFAVPAIRPAGAPNAALEDG